MRDCYFVFFANEILEACSSALIKCIYDRQNGEGLPFDGDAHIFLIFRVGKIEFAAIALADRTTEKCRNFFGVFCLGNIENDADLILFFAVICKKIENESIVFCLNRGADIFVCEKITDCFFIEISSAADLFSR